MSINTVSTKLVKKEIFLMIYLFLVNSFSVFGCKVTKKISNTQIYVRLNLHMSGKCRIFAHN